MSFDLALAPLLSFHESIQPSLTGYGLGDRWQLQAGFHPDRPFDARSFGIVGLDLENNGPMNSANTKRRSFMTFLHVRFPTGIDDQLYLHKAIASDFERITDWLQNPENWGRPTSTIETVALQTTDNVHLRGRLLDAAGGVDLVIGVRVKYRGGGL